MNVLDALKALKNEQPIMVKGKTFQPSKIDIIHLSTGETEYWVHGEDHVWLSIDSDSEEVRMFQDIDEDLEPTDDAVSYAGDDYEFSLEGEGKVLDEEGEQLDTVEFREYESSHGEILRLTKFEVSEDMVDVALGFTVTEDDLRKV